MILVVQEPGTRLGKTSEQIKILQNGREFKVAFRLVEAIVCLTRCSISYDVNLAAAEYGIPIFYIRKGHPMAATLPYAHHGFVITRKAQFEAYSNEKGTRLMEALIIGALTNKIRILKYYARNVKRQDEKTAANYHEHIKKMEILRKNALKVVKSSRLHTKIKKQENNTQQNNTQQKSKPRVGKSQEDISVEKIDGKSESKIRSQLMGYEGSGSRMYYAILIDLLPKDLGFKKRVRRPPTDPVNAAISFGNHLLANEIMIAVVAAGLEPFAGFLHTDRSGRPSLVFDLMEEFRQPVVDRLLMRLFRKRILQAKQFNTEAPAPDSGVKFTNEGMEIFLREFYYLVRKQGEHVKGRFWTYQQLMLRQARQLVRYFLGKEVKYRPFQFKW